MDTNILFKPNTKHLYQLQPQRSHPRLSLTRILYVKIIRWIDDAKLPALLRTVRRIFGTLLLAFLIFVPQFSFGLMADIFRWNSFRIPLFFGLLFLTLNFRRLHRFARRRYIKMRYGESKGNAKTYEGLPVDELASYLFDNGFKRDHALRTLGISKLKHEKIARQLESHEVLVRDDNNGRVLNPNLTRELLVRQLRENFPLRFVDGQWAEYRGSYERFLRDKEKREQEERTKIGRLQRKKEKLQDDIQTLGFIRREVAL